MLLNDGRDLAAEAACDRRFVAHQRSAGLFDRFDYCFDVPRADGAKINDFTRNVELLLRLFRGFEANVHLRVPVDIRQKDFRNVKTKTKRLEKCKNKRASNEHLRAPRNNGDVATLSDNFCLAEGDFIVADGHLLH